MKIIYSQKIDKRIFKEVNKECPRLSKIFGFEFKKIKFDKRIIPIAKNVAKTSKYFVKEKKVKSIMESIFNKKVPVGITVYINTTPFCTWNVREKWISISMRFVGKEFFNKVCHEMNHFMYDYTFKTKKYQNTKIKEIITVVNNAFNVYDKGWNKFHKERKAAFKKYQETKNIEEVVRQIRNK